MEMTIEEALAKGIEAHRAGQLQSAERFYSAILKSDPKHSDANHNLGVLAMNGGKVEDSLSLFKAAIETNPTVSQYWLNYITALLKLGRKTDARTVYEQAISLGAKGAAYDQFSAQFAGPDSDEVCHWKETALKEFYHQMKRNILTAASSGWVFSLTFDQVFVDANTPIADNADPAVARSEECFESKRRTPPLGPKSPREVLEQLNKTASIQDKYAGIQNLLKSHAPVLTDDSYAHSENRDINQIQQEVFHDGRWNIVIVGGGATGLFLANTLKNRFGEGVNIIVLDSRSDADGSRKIFDRNWLTYLDSKYVQKNTSSHIKNLMECFGTNGKIGMPLDVFEAVLMISCKDQGVKFYFSPEVDYTHFDSDLIDCYFDATGGRLMHRFDVSPSGDALDIQVPDAPSNSSYAGVRRTRVPEPHLQFSLKPSGGKHFVYFDDRQILYHMVKVTKVPAELTDELIQFVAKHNGDNIFYIWKGALKTEINETLIFINLTSDYLKTLSSLVAKPRSLESFLQAHASSTLEALDPRITQLFEILAAHARFSEIEIEPPFSYQPYVSFESLRTSPTNKPVFSIGDSLFCGHPKVGNGLNFHVSFINALIEKVSSTPNLVAHQG